MLIVAEHYRSVTPSALVLCYSVLKGLFGMTILRTYQLRGLVGWEVGPLNGMVASAAFADAAYYIIFIVEMIEKRRLLKRKVTSFVREQS